MLFLLASLTSLALAQDDDSPWGDLLDDEPEVPPFEEKAAAPLAPTDALHDLDRVDPVQESGFTPSGYRIAAMGGTHGIRVGEAAVLGGDGGTNVTTVSTRVVYNEYSLAVSLPFAAYRTPEGRTTDLGNLGIAGMYVLDQGDLRHGIGLDLHFNPGGQPYTWANQAEEIWPGGGVNAVYQLQTSLGDGLTVMGRGSFGVHSAQDFEPFHKIYPRFGAAAGVDQAVNDLVGLVAETSVSYWDVSPWEVTGLVRVDPFPALRARAGFLFPILTWAGASPVERPAGVRETTLIIDIGMAL